MTGHKHASDPYLQVDYTLDTPTAGTSDKVIVSWSESVSKSFDEDADLSETAPRGNEAKATKYTVSLYKGETPSTIPTGADNALTVTSRRHNTSGTSFEFSGTVAGGRTAGTTIDVRSDTLVLDLFEANVTGKGFYWVKIEVEVPDGDETTGDIQALFAKQIAVDPDYKLSVSRSSVREDEKPIDIPVTVTVSGDAVANDTSVPLELGLGSKTELNKRFRIDFPTMTILKGQKSAVGTIKFTPIDSDTTPDDDLLINIKTIGAPAADGSTDIRLIDTDKESTAIDLSFSPATLNKTDGRTPIQVTATLNGKTLTDHVSFNLVIDEEYGNSADRAQRDTDYTAEMAAITIRRNQVEAEATIFIRPKNKGVGFIRIKAPSDKATNTPSTISVAVNPSSLNITSGPDPDKVFKGLTATPFSVREDFSGEKKIKLEVSLQTPLPTRETVTVSIPAEPTKENIARLEDSRFDDAEPAKRDVHYRAQVEAFDIPAGETTGETTLTVEPVDNTEEDGLRAFVVNVIVGGVPFSTGILLTDDDTTSDSITLEVDPTEIAESDGATPVTVTGTLNGKTFKNSVIVALVIDTDFDYSGDNKADADDANATRDFDYTANVSPLVIPGGSVSGTTTITITPIADTNKESDEKIRLESSGQPAANDEHGDEVKLTVAGATITLKDTLEAGATPSTDPTKLAFADTVAAQTYTVGTAITDLVLPEATGGRGDLTYGVSTLPAGLSFVPATRTISGTPTQATAATNIFYTVADTANAPVALSFSITVNEAVVPPPSADDVKLTVTPSSVREDAGATEVALSVTLAEAKATADTVMFTIVAPSEGQQAVRDVDYQAVVNPQAIIPAGETVGTTTLTFTPKNNTTVDSLRALGVQAAFASGATLVQDLHIVDDETASTSIVLSVSPSTVSEEDGETTVTVTAALDGKALSDNTYVTVTINSTSTADRDVDYSVTDFSPWIEIPAGSTTGSTEFKIRPTVDNEEEGNETIKLTSRIDGLMADEVEITLIDPVAEPATPDDSSFAFVTKVEDQTYTAGTAIPPLVLPPAEGGTGTIKYLLSLSSSLAGLSFDPTTRTLSGTPSAATTSPALVLYAALAEDAETILRFYVTVNEPQLSSLAFADTVADQEYTVGEAITDLVLPEATGGTGALTYRVLGLPAGLSFDAATRTLSGTPTAATDGAVVYIYIVEDEDRERAQLYVNITVNESSQSVPLAFAADAEIADQEYTVGEAITDLVLPEATGGTGALTYRVLGLPTGLVFDAATRTLSGTPTAATDGAVEVLYTVVDEDAAERDELRFTITVNAKLTFDLSDLFGSGKIVPTEVQDGATIREFVVGEYMDGLVLPESTGGTAPLTYSVSPALPAGLTFDATTRTIAGTPQAASETVYTYTVTDANGASASLALQVLPAAFSLADNFPNPFNPATTIQYALPTATDVNLTVYNVVGQVVRTLVAEHQSAGRYMVEWDATDDSGHSLSAGMYFYRLQAGGEFAEVKKMLLLK